MDVAEFVLTRIDWLKRHPWYSILVASAAVVIWAGQFTESIQRLSNVLKSSSNATLEQEPPTRPTSEWVLPSSTNGCVYLIFDSLPRTAESFPQEVTFNIDGFVRQVSFRTRDIPQAALFVLKGYALTDKIPMSAELNWTGMFGGHGLLFEWADTLTFVSDARFYLAKPQEGLPSWSERWFVKSVLSDEEGLRYARRVDLTIPSCDHAAPGASW